MSFIFKVVSLLPVFNIDTLVGCKVVNWHFLSLRILLSFQKPFPHFIQDLNVCWLTLNELTFIVNYSKLY